MHRHNRTQSQKNRPGELGGLNSLGLCPLNHTEVLGFGAPQDLMLSLSVTPANNGEEHNVNVSTTPKIKTQIHLLCAE